MFSERYGYTPEKTIQNEKVSDTLRRRIWNLYYQQEIKEGGLASEQLIQVLNGKQTLDEKIADRLGFLIKPTVKGKSAQEQLESYILHFGAWNEVYDFIDIHLSYLAEDDQVNRIKQYNQLLKLKDSGVHIHAAMEKAFLALYGYASDENGIRHRGIDFTNVPSEDAKYMLVSCSAFVNYLIEKWSKVN